MSDTAPYQGLDKQTNEVLKRQARGFSAEEPEKNFEGMKNKIEEFEGKK